MRASDRIQAGSILSQMGGQLLAPGEHLSVKAILLRVMLCIATHGKMQIYCVYNDGLVHTSYLVPKCAKFTFLHEDNYEIGPCYTAQEHRGKGIYPAVLCSICSEVGNEESKFFMIVDESNKSSIRGIEKASFVMCGQVKVNRFTKRYSAELLDES